MAMPVAEEVAAWESSLGRTAGVLWGWGPSRKFVVRLVSVPDTAVGCLTVAMRLMMEEEAGWNLVYWTKLACGLGRTENELDRGMDLSETGASGSRPVEDHILEREEHCQEREDSLPMSSTTQVQVEGELDYSPGRIETSAATWVGTGS